MLTDRQEQILRLIVQLYGQYKEPIGSKRLLEESVLDVSSATIRNDMKSLENQGYLSKTHTSSGRVPSENGYRFYINLLLSEDLPAERLHREFAELDHFLKSRHRDVFEVAKLAADTISQMTGYVTVLLTSGAQDHLVTEFRLVSLDAHSFIGIIMTDKGVIDSQLFKTHFALEASTLDQLTDALREEVLNISLEAATQKAKLTLPLLVQRLIGYQMDFTQLFDKALMTVLSERYYVSGKDHLFNILDIREGAETFQKLFHFVDGSSEMYQLLEKAKPYVDVIYGLENESGDFSQLSMITGNYTYQNQEMTMGLIGPSTMNYKDHLGLMTHVLTELTH